jgi:hypothetical protein
VQFNEQSKKLTLVLNTDNLRNSSRIDFAVPRDLIGGNYTILVNGVAQPNQNDQYYSTDSYTWFSPVVNKTSSDRITVDVIGTTVVPEFGSVTQLLLMIGLGTLIAYTGILRNVKLRS